MATGVRQTSVLARRAATARERSQRLRAEYERLAFVQRHLLGECLVTRTTRLDACEGTQVDRERVGRLSRAVGRDPAIEDAKILLADRHGLTTGEAFELLRRISQHSNRKLRDVARAAIEAESAGNGSRG